MSQGVSGSGPAYFFLFIESLIKAGQDMGLDAKVSEKLALQTALGAARMATETDQDVETLRKMVTSPHGTTEAAIVFFQRNGLGEMVAGAASAARERGQEIGKELGEQ